MADEEDYGHGYNHCPSDDKHYKLSDGCQDGNGIPSDGISLSSNLNSGPAIGAIVASVISCLGLLTLAGLLVLVARLV